MSKVVEYKNMIPFGNNICFAPYTGSPINPHIMKLKLHGLKVTLKNKTKPVILKPNSFLHCIDRVFHVINGIRIHTYPKYQVHVTHSLSQHRKYTEGMDIVEYLPTPFPVRTVINNITGYEISFEMLGLAQMFEDEHNIESVSWEHITLLVENVEESLARDNIYKLYYPTGPACANNWCHDAYLIHEQKYGKKTCRDIFFYVKEGFITGIGDRVFDPVRCFMADPAEDFIYNEIGAGHNVKEIKTIGTDTVYAIGYRSNLLYLNDGGAIIENTS